MELGVLKVLRDSAIDFVREGDVSGLRLLRLGGMRVS